VEAAVRKILEGARYAYSRTAESVKFPENKLYRIALIGAFEFSFELGWKTLKDYLNFGGVDVTLPREVIKQSFHHALVQNGKIWIEMLEDRNLMAYVYDDVRAQAVCARIIAAYVPVLLELQKFLSSKGAS
jgi:nucleotidyltransferase substrate binding protein (TIGR01987 family)